MTSSELVRLRCGQVGLVVEWRRRGYDRSYWPSMVDLFDAHVYVVECFVGEDFVPCCAQLVQGFAVLLVNLYRCFLHVKESCLEMSPSKLTRIQIEHFLNVN